MTEERGVVSSWRGRRSRWKHRFHGNPPAPAREEAIPGVKVVAVEPAVSAGLCGRPAVAHHIEGIGAGYVPSILNVDMIDDTVTVEDREPFKMTELLARKQSRLLKISSGADVAGGRQEEARFSPGQNAARFFATPARRTSASKSVSRKKKPIPARFSCNPRTSSVENKQRGVRRRKARTPQTDLVELQRPMGRHYGLRGVDFAGVAPASAALSTFCG